MTTQTTSTAAFAATAPIEEIHDALERTLGVDAGEARISPARRVTVEWMRVARARYSAATADLRLDEIHKAATSTPSRQETDRMDATDPHLTGVLDALLADHASTRRAAHQATLDALTHVMNHGADPTADSRGELDRLTGRMVGLNTTVFVERRLIHTVARLLGPGYEHHLEGGPSRSAGGR